MGMLKVMIMPYVACSRLDRKVSSLILGFMQGPCRYTHCFRITYM